MPNAACIFQEPGQDLGRVEAYLSELLSQLLEADLLCICKGKCGPAVRRPLDLSFLTGSGTRFSLGFDKPLWQAADHFQHLLRLAGRLEVSQQVLEMRWPFIVDEESPLTIQVGSASI